MCLLFTLCFPSLEWKLHEGRDSCLSPDASQAEQGLAQDKCSLNRAVKKINNKHLLWAWSRARPEEAPANRTFTL